MLAGALGAAGMQQDGAGPRSAQQAFASSLAANTPTVYPEPIATHEEVCSNRETFDSALFRLLTAFGITLKVPKIANQEINIHLLYNEVTKRGGLEQVIAKKMFVAVCEPFTFPSSFTNKSFVVRKLYCNMLHHFEQVYFLRKGGMPVVPPPISEQQQQHRTRFRDNGSPSKRSHSRPRPQPFGRSVSTPRALMPGMPSGSLPNFCPIGYNSPMNSPSGKRKQGADPPLLHHGGPSLLGHSGAGALPAKVIMQYFPLGVPKFDSMSLKPLIRATNMAQSTAGMGPREQDAAGSGNTGGNTAGGDSDDVRIKSDPSPTNSCSSGSRVVTPPVLAPYGLEVGLEFPCRIIADQGSYYIISMHVPGMDALVGQLVKALPPDVTLCPTTLPHQLIYERRSTATYDACQPPHDALANNMTAGGASGGGDGSGTSALDREDAFGTMDVLGFPPFAREWDHSSAGAAAGVLIDPTEVSGDATADVVAHVAHYSPPGQQECAKKLRLASNGGWAPVIPMSEHCWPPVGDAVPVAGTQPFVMPGTGGQTRGPNSYSQFREHDQYGQLQPNLNEDDTSLLPGQVTLDAGTTGNGNNPMPGLGGDATARVQHTDDAGMHRSHDGATSEATDNGKQALGTSMPSTALGTGGEAFHTSGPLGSMAGASAGAYNYPAGMGGSYDGHERLYHDRSSGMGSRPGTAGALPSARNNGNMSSDGSGSGAKMVMAHLNMYSGPQPPALMVPNMLGHSSGHSMGPMVQYPGSKKGSMVSQLGSGHGYYPSMAKYPTVAHTGFAPAGYGGYQQQGVGYGHSLVPDHDDTPNYGMVADVGLARPLNQSSYDYQPAIYSDHHMMREPTSKMLHYQRMQQQARQLQNNGNGHFCALASSCPPPVSLLMNEADNGSAWATGGIDSNGMLRGSSAGGRGMGASHYAGLPHEGGADEDEMIHMTGQHADGADELFSRMDISGGGAPLASARMQGGMNGGGLHVDTSRDGNMHGVGNGDMPSAGAGGQILTPGMLLNNPSSHYLNMGDAPLDLNTPEDIMGHCFGQCDTEQRMGGMLGRLDGHVGQGAGQGDGSAAPVNVAGPHSGAGSLPSSSTQTTEGAAPQIAAGFPAADGVCATGINSALKLRSAGSKQMLVLSEAALAATPFAN